MVVVDLWWGIIGSFLLEKSAGEPFAQASFWTLFIRITKCKLVSNTHTSENYFQEFLVSDFFFFSNVSASNYT